ncbi:STAS domain-containing protein [Streptomyces sp. NRRL S-1022]|uniref:STAS domain-containing protein n=1 Tax=Streptomyces sp. NRRL S-1022 TaxID=1463880 RepID=UPI00068A0AC7|nr:STAS domain-containing protein [Streptomyces sp. NRRL S-1022]
MGSTPEYEGRTMRVFTAETQQHTDRTVITVCGEMDLQTCPELIQAASGVPVGGKPLYLDLSGVTFMDSSGLNLLVKLRRRLQAEGAILAVTGLQSQPARLLEMTQTSELFTPHTTAAPARMSP